MLIRTKKFKIYVDFDGVIKDTHIALFDDYPEKDNNHEFVRATEHVIKKDWIYVLEKSPVIGDAINIVNEIEDDTAVLSHVHSLENEAVAKIHDLRELGLKREIILVPYTVKKTDVVPAKGNILADDAIFNCDAWYNCEGLPIFFDRHGNNIDGWGNQNTKYARARSLEVLKNHAYLEELIRTNRH